MGNAQTTNIANLTTEAVASVSSSIIQDASQSGAVNQGIIVKNTKGNVVISGNKQDATIEISMQALSKALVTQSAQQQLAAKLAQKAKSVVSGINLFQFTNADNEVDMFMKASIDISTHIAQSCATSGATTQVIEVSDTDGDVTVTNNTQTGLVKLFQSCVQNAVSQNSALQSIQAQIDQSAEADSKGFSVWALVAMAIIGLLMLILPEILVFVFGVNSVIKVVTTLLFPLIAVGGIVFIILYYTMTDSKMVSYGFSNMISNTENCMGTPGTTSTNYKSAILASKACQDDSTCEGVDWKGTKIDRETGAGSKIDPPQTTFYTSISEDPCAHALSQTKDQLKILGIPKLTVGQAQPSTGSDGEIYIDQKLNYSLWDGESKSWNNLTNPTNPNPLLPNFTGAVTLGKAGSLPPNPTDTNNKDQVVIQYSSSTSAYLDLYEWNGAAWDKTELSIPGPIPTVSQNPINYSTLKEKRKRPFYLYIGLGLLVVGLIGTFINFAKKSKKSKIVPIEKKK